MQHVAVVGTQWGDEGKGKIVDLLAEDADIVARCQGGANAGHTVFIKGERFALNLIPTGILHPDKTCLIGNGVVTDLCRLFEEIEGLKNRNISAADRLFISGLSHLVMPYHKWLERHVEDLLSDNSIGTTLRGIGPTYSDKYTRLGIRVYDLYYPELLKAKLETNFRLKKEAIDKYGEGDLANLHGLFERLQGYAKLLRPMVVDASIFLEKAHQAGKVILFEGAQGALLDIDYGTFPYVTSSNTTIGGTLTGLGIPPHYIGRVIGIVKAYQTRVGNGPFPTEQNNDLGEFLRKEGKEFGTATGRPRRTGWLDLVLLKYTARINGLTDLAITKLDVLDGLDEIKVCVDYKLADQNPDFLIANLDRAEPIYETLPGWNTSIKGKTRYDDLPLRAKEYIRFIEDRIGCKAMIISTGVGREETILI